MSMVLCAMTLRSFMGNDTIDEMGARTSPAKHHTLLCKTGNGAGCAWQMMCALLLVYLTAHHCTMLTWLHGAEMCLSA